MSDVADYDLDILLWSERQAALLRGLKERARGLPNELDLENVAEEIESVGRSELAAVRSLLRRLLEHLVKVVSKPDGEVATHLLSEIRAFQSDLADRLTPSMIRNIDMQKIWRQAVKNASADLADFGDAPGAVPDVFPFSVADIVSDDFELKSAIEALRDTPLLAQPAKGRFIKRFGR